MWPHSGTMSHILKTTGSDSYAKEVEFLTVRRGRMAGEAQEVVVL